MTAVLSVKAVSKRFSPRLSLGDRIAARLGAPIETRTVHAVDGVSLDLNKGEILGLVGESGCGKSTLGRIIVGIHAASEGDVLLEGVPVRDAAHAGRKTTTRIQMVFQDPFASLDPRIRIGEAIGEGPLVHGLTTRSQVRDYVGQWLTAVGLPLDAYDRFPHQFSGGQRQRVAIARALAMQSDILVCDEPVASLDVSIQAQIVNLFLKLRRELGLTILFISHDLGVVRHLCDRIAVMYLGRIVETGSAQDIYERPAHPYTRALIDSVPKLITETGEAAVFHPIQGELPSPLSPPSGCHFHGRCAFAQPRCHTEVPERHDVANGRDVACHFPLEEK